ncbi:MAG: vWA domain-containing protein [Polyangiales bacterium]
MKRLLLIGLFAVACSANKGDDSSAPDKLKDSGVASDGDFELDGGTLDPDGGTTPEGGGTTCAASHFAAEPSIAPVDIIWVVDSSGSMDNEAKRVQDNLNDFSTAISKVGLDYHVVMITSSAFVKVPPPLGTSPNYQFVERDVASNAPLQAIIEEFPKYSSFLRPSAVTHVVAVTDDESDMKAEDFYKDFSGKIGHGFTGHAIASETVPITFTNPTGACQTSGFPPEGAAAPGVQYYKLADATKGLKFSICTSDWTGLFKALTAAVAVPAKLPCDFLLPTGTDVDPTKVNVDWTKATGSKETLLYVGEGGKGACTAAGGWYYDNPKMPTHVILCPSSCTGVSADKMGKIDLALGCETRIK